MGITESANFIEEISDVLKPLSSANDLVKLGLVGSVKSLANQRCYGTGPDYIKLKGAGVRYPKQGIIAWLKRDAVYVRSFEKETTLRTGGELR